MVMVRVKDRITTKVPIRDRIPIRDQNRHHVTRHWRVNCYKPLRVEFPDSERHSRICDTAGLLVKPMSPLVLAHSWHRVDRAVFQRHYILSEGTVSVVDLEVPSCSDRDCVDYTVLHNDGFAVLVIGEGGGLCERWGRVWTGFCTRLCICAVSRRSPRTGGGACFVLL